jgi:hypothetical protein
MDENSPSVVRRPPSFSEEMGVVTIEVVAPVLSFLYH